MKRYLLLALLCGTAFAQTYTGTFTATVSGNTVTINGTAATPVVTPPPPPPSAGAGLINQDTWDSAIPNAGIAMTGPAGTSCAPGETPTVALTGAHHTYHIGGAGADTFASVPWGTLQAGDVVNIYPGTYKVHFGLRAQGTAANPVIINGISDANCNLPIIQGSGAVSAGNEFFTPWTEGLGVVEVLRNTQTDAYGGVGCLKNAAACGYQPQYILIQGLWIQNAPNGSTYVPQYGSSGNWSNAGCIWLQVGMHLSVRHAILTGCGFGLFVMAKDDLLSQSVQYLHVANNRIYGDGASGFSDHNAYIQANAPIVEGNYFGTVAAGSAGSSFKDRSAQLIFRRNTVSCAAQCLDLVHSENQGNSPPSSTTDGISTLPWYGTDYVYSNVITSSGATCFHYGGDNLGEQNSSGVTSTIMPPPQPPYRKHLYFWNNTCTLNSAAYNQALMKLSLSATTVDFWANTVNTAGWTGSGALSWLWWAGVLNLGSNTVNGKAPAPAWNNGPGATAILGQYTFNAGASIPTDPNLALLH